MFASQHVVHDAVVSNKHLRIYTIVFDDNQSDGVAPLVYAEDLSRNGTYWNNSLIGRGNGGVLLSNGDTLRISPRIYYHFQGGSAEFEEQPFDLTQECEMKVGGNCQMLMWVLILCSISKQSTMSPIENWAPGLVVKSSWLSNSRDELSSLAKSWISAS
jgi:FHA domain